MRVHHLNNVSRAVQYLTEKCQVSLHCLLLEAVCVRGCTCSLHYPIVMLIFKPSVVTKDLTKIGGIRECTQGVNSLVKCLSRSQGIIIGSCVLSVLIMSLFGLTRISFSVTANRFMSFLWITQISYFIVASLSNAIKLLCLSIPGSCALDSFHSLSMI